MSPKGTLHRPIKILVFIEGTISGRVNRPTRGAVKKITAWKKQHASIFYLTAGRKLKSIERSREFLGKWGFPEGEVFVRREGEEYWDVAERLAADIIVEDNCRSIGGQPEMTYPNMNLKLKEKTKSVVVEEFEGLEHLPDRVEELMRFQGSVGWEGKA